MWGKNKMYMKKRFNSHIFCLIFIVLILLGILYIRGTRYAIAKDNYKTVEWKECIDKINEYETNDENDFRVMGEDPWVLLDFASLGESIVKGLTIELDREIDLSKVQIFYGRETTDFSEVDSDIMNGFGRTIEVNSQKALEGFRYIRLDIDTDFCIESFNILTDHELVYSNQSYEYVCMIFVNFFIAFLCAFSVKVNAIRVCLWERFKELREKLINNGGTIFKKIIIPLVVIGIVFLGELVFHEYSGNEYINIYRVLIFSCILSVGIYAILYKNICWKYAHIYFFILAISVGTVTILTVPAISQMVFDDEIHYFRAADLSWGSKGVVSSADSSIMVANSAVYDHVFRKEWENGINQRAETNFLLDTETIGGPKIRIWTPAYIPSSVGLILGRGMKLSFTNTFRLGKWMNLLCYSILFSLSIKLIKGRGKILIAIIGMIPTNLYMASSYTYDWWVIGFIVLGYALFIKEMQIHHVVRLSKLVKILFVMAIGLLPKVVYFPLLFPIVILSGIKDKRIQNLRILTISTIIFLVAVTVLSILLRKIGLGDSRGGTSVNTVEQIKFIFTNPLQYIKILFGFLQEYLSPDAADEYLTRMGYYGKAKYWSVCLLCIGIGAIFDNEGINEDAKKVKGRKIIMGFSCFVSIVLVVTALYVAFTPVALSTIEGCQHRYILPILFPFLYFLGELDININDEMKRKMFVILLSIMAVILLYGLYDLRVRYF